MSASLMEIRTLAMNVQSYAPALRMGYRLDKIMHKKLIDLAEACGLPEAYAVSDADLISIYLTAIKDPRAGQRVAQRVTARLEDVLSGVPGTASPLPPEPLPNALPATREPAITHDRVRAMVREEVTAGVLVPVEKAIDDLRADFDAIAKDASTAAYVNALEAMREAMVIEAQAAAEIALKDLRPTLLDIIRDPLAPEPVSLGLVHRETPKILNALKAGVNVYLHGPAGSGKTTVAHKCAEAFGLEFRFAAKVESEYQLIGFKDAKGDTVRTQFRDAYEHGGVFLFDEMDASSPSAVVALNAALANGHCPFPDAIVKRHPMFYCIGAGNTKLTGANRQYAGRNQLDAASIDRFAFIEFGYDNELELALATDTTWARYVQSVRQAVADRGLNHLVTPRATYDGCRLLAAGFDRDTVKSMVVYKGLDEDTVRQIEQAL